MFRPLQETDAEELLRFLLELDDDDLFNPHPRTLEDARAASSNRGKDRYYGIFFSDANVMIAYGMLRGLDEGFECPSLGIAVRKKYRRHGFGSNMMDFLHIEARKMGATKIRLRVHPLNGAAKLLYKSFGYEYLDEIDRGEEVWWITL